MKQAKILVVDDDPAIVEAISYRLREKGYEVVTAGDGKEGIEKLGSENPEVMILDLKLPRMGGLEVLEKMRKQGDETPVVVITAYESVKVVVDAIKAGADDFITKPLDIDHLFRILEKILERRELAKNSEYLHNIISDEKEKLRMIGDNREMKGIMEIARKAADSRSTILILGESGTGKEVLARTIHHMSPRADRPLVTVNCVALKEELLESELFGHEKGAFTSAYKARKGRIELADAGTLFLDEIGDVPPSFQAKFLRVLQEGCFERLGSNTSVSVNIRVIAATNQNLKKAIDEGRFREDLYFRLNVVTLNLPPLRDRKDDIPALVNYFIERYNGEAKKNVEGIEDSAMACLLSYPWQGNIRELENAIERAIVLRGEGLLKVEDFTDAITEQSPGDEKKSGQFQESVAEFKTRLIREALAKTGGNQSKASEALGLSYPYFCRLIKNLKIR